MNRHKLVKKLAAIVVAVVIVVGVVATYKYAPKADTTNDSFIGTNFTAEISAEDGQALPAGLSVYLGTKRTEVTDRTISLPDTPAGVIGFSGVGLNSSVWKVVIDNEVVDGIVLEPGVNEYPVITLRRVSDPYALEPADENNILPRISQVSPSADVIALETAATISFSASDGDGNQTLASNPLVYYRESCDDAANFSEKWKIARTQKDGDNYKTELKPTSTFDSTCLEYIIEAIAPSGAGALYPKDGIASGATVPKILARRPEAIGTFKFTASGITDPAVEVPFEITDTRGIADYIKPHLIGKKCFASGKDKSCEIKNVPVLLGENSYAKVHPTTPAGYSSKYGDLWIGLNFNGKTQTGGAVFDFIKERNPIIKSATPVNGNIGSMISLKVEDVGLGNEYTVKFGGVKATYQYSEYPYTSNTIKVALPRGAKSGLVTLEQDGKIATGPNITVNIVNASVNSKPVITSITPKTTSTGKEITINGNNFDSNAIVSFYPKGRAGVSALNAEIISGKVIKALVPYVGNNQQVKVGVQIGSKKVVSSQIITVR